MCVCGKARCARCRREFALPPVAMSREVERGKCFPPRYVCRNVADDESELVGPKTSRTLTDTLSSSPVVGGASRGLSSTSMTLGDPRVEVLAEASRERGGS